MISKQRADYLLEHKAIEVIDEENIIPLGDKETLEKIGEEIEKHIEEKTEVKPKKTKKKKSSKK